MKKWALFLMILSFSCLSHIQGMAAMCPAERPLLIGGPWKNENCPEFQIISFYKLLSSHSPDWDEIPLDLCRHPVHCGKGESEEYKIVCQELEKLNKTMTDLRLKRDKSEITKYEYDHTRYIYEYNLMTEMIRTCKADENGDEELCLKLEELKNTLNDIDGKILQIERNIEDENLEIVEINQVIQEKGDKYKKIAQYNHLCEVKPDAQYHYGEILSGRWDDSIVIHVLDQVCDMRFLLQQYVEGLEYIIKPRLDGLELLEGEEKDRQYRNLHTCFDNLKLEKTNDATLLEFEKFYTPEKEKQLLHEYEKVLSERCVSCDYPEPLDIQKENCNLCPNRDYVDGKCVLKKE